jgi:ADP-ribosylation factor-like protein 3
MTGVPLLIFANKQDLSLSLDPDEIMDLINLNNIKDRQWTIIACSAMTKQGLQDGISWLCDVLKN